MARSAQEILHGINQRELTASRNWQRTKEAGIFSGLAASATFSVFITAAIIVVLFTESIRFFERPEVSLPTSFSVRNGRLCWAARSISASGR